MCRSTSARLNTPDKLTALRVDAPKSVSRLAVCEAYGGTQIVECHLALSCQSYFVLLPLPYSSVMCCIVTSYLNNISEFVWKASGVCTAKITRSADKDRVR